MRITLRPLWGAESEITHDAGRNYRQAQAAKKPALLFHPLALDLRSRPFFKWSVLGPYHEGPFCNPPSRRGLGL
jgi:hypothetical protein